MGDTTIARLTYALCLRLAVLGVMLAAAGTMLHAQTETIYTIRVQQTDGTPVPNVEIHGNKGVRSLATPFTNAQGERPIDTKELLDSNAVIALAHTGFVFDPPEFALSDLSVCKNRVCSVTAIPDAHGSSVVYWSFSMGTSGIAYPGIEAVLEGALNTCPKISDSEGVTVFATRRRSESCLLHTAGR